MDLIQSNNSSASKLPSYIGMSTLSLAPNLTTALRKCPSTTFSSPTYSTSTSSLSASLMSPKSGVLLCATSIASNFAWISLISLSIAQLDKGGSTCLLGGILMTVPHTQSTPSRSFSLPENNFKFWYHLMVSNYFLCLLHLKSTDEIRLWYHLMQASLLSSGCLTS